MYILKTCYIPIDTIKRLSKVRLGNVMSSNENDMARLIFLLILQAAEKHCDENSKRKGEGAPRLAIGARLMTSLLALFLLLLLLLLLPASFPSSLFTTTSVIKKVLD